MATAQNESTFKIFYKMVGKVQKQIPALRKEGLVRVLKGEIAVREVLSNVFDDGLTLLGRSIVVGRKVTGHFVAKTNKKVNQLVKLTDKTVDSRKAAKVITEAMVKANAKLLTPDAAAKKAAKILKHKSAAFKTQVPRHRKSRTHAAPVARTH